MKHQLPTLINLILTRAPWSGYDPPQRGTNMKMVTETICQNNNEDNLQKTVDRVDCREKNIQKMDS